MIYRTKAFEDAVKLAISFFVFALAGWITYTLLKRRDERNNDVL